MLKNSLTKNKDFNDAELQRPETGVCRWPVFFPSKEFSNYYKRCFNALGWYSTRLVVAIIPEGASGAVTFATAAGDEWYISLTHSVEKTAWNDYFRVNGANNMTMTHTRFSSLGWGYPYSAADGKLTQTADGKFDMEMNRPYKEVALRISEQAMPHIVHGGDSYDLIALYGQGTAVTVKAMYRYQYWLERYF